MTRITESSPRLIARTAGFVYLMVFVTGIFSLFVRTRLGFAAGLVAAVCYVAVTLLFYYIFRPVNRSLSLLAAILSFLGCIVGPLGLFVHAVSHINPLVFFGFYCLLIGYLIFNSTFLPRILGVLMALAGLGWLTFLWPPLGRQLFLYVAAVGLFGSLATIGWFLVVGVDEERWRAQASAAQRSIWR